MGKLNLNAPTHKANILVSYTVSNKTYTINIASVPIIFDVQNVSNVPTATGTASNVTRRYQVILHKDYIEGKLLKASDNTTLPLLISRFVAGTDNGGYSVKITLLSDSVSTPIDEEGYNILQFEIKYGDYSDGAYRQYLELNHISTVIYA